MKGKLSVSLEPDRFDRAKERKSLGELLEAAAAVTFPRSAEDDKRAARKEAMWIARMAIRAVANEIIRTGQATFPLNVRFEPTHRSGWWDAANWRN